MRLLPFIVFTLTSLAFLLYASAMMLGWWAILVVPLGAIVVLAIVLGPVLVLN